MCPSRLLPQSVNTTGYRSQAREGTAAAA